MMTLLEGIRVLDFGRFIAGPYCAALLGDHGADVVRIERPEGAEDRYLLPVTDDGEGATFLQMNRNKRSLALDPGHPQGRRIVQRLVRDADVIVANLPPQTLKRMGLDWDTVSALNPRIVLTAPTAFGTVGPYADRVGFDSVGQAMSGAMFMSGLPDAPSRAAVPYIDFHTAMAGAFGTMAALLARERTGRGQKVEPSLLRSGIIHANTLLMEQALRKPDRVPIGNRSFAAGPVDVFRARDGWIIVHTIGASMFERWCQLVGRPELRDDPRFADDLLRGDHGAELSGIMADWCARRTVAQALDEMAAVKLPGAPVLSPQQALDDPHIREAGLLQPMTYPGLAGTFPLAAHPAELSETPASYRRPPPRLGEHSAEVLGEIGLSGEEIGALVAQGVVGVAG